MRKINRKQFDNGLVLLTEKIPSKKKVTLFAGVKVGAVNETDKLDGGSHFNEHLLFKSNKYRSAKQIAEDLEQTGTNINAFTSETKTVFYAKSLPAGLTKAVQVIYEAATNFDYSLEEFEKERGVILTEMSMYKDDPMQYLSMLFQSLLFQGTPLERTTVGTKEAMSSVTKEELASFKREYYIPNNMAVVAVGNFDEESLEQKLKETFGALPGGKTIPTVSMAAIENRHSEKFEGKDNIEQTYLVLGYRVPGMTHKDAFSLNMLGGVLSAGMSSRLFQKLREEKGIGYGVGAYHQSFWDVGCFCAYIAGFDPKRFDEAKEVIFKEFKDLKRNLATEKEFERTKNMLISGLYERLESIDFRARQILEQEFGKLPHDFRKVESYIRKVTREQVREVANKYLTDDYTLTALEPAKKK